MKENDDKWQILRNSLERKLKKMRSNPNRFDFDKVYGIKWTLEEMDEIEEIDILKVKK